MNQMLEFLHEQVKSKLEEDGISIKARNILIEIKLELAEMLKEKLTLKGLPAVEAKLEMFTKQLKELK